MPHPADSRLRIVGGTEKHHQHLEDSRGLAGALRLSLERLAKEAYLDLRDSGLEQPLRTVQHTLEAVGRVQAGLDYLRGYYEPVASRKALP